MKRVLIEILKYFPIFLLTAFVAALAIPGFFLMILGIPLILAIALFPTIFALFFFFLRGFSRLAKFRILVVDNDKAFQATVAKKVDQRKWQLDVQDSSYKAIGEILSQNSYDLIMIRRMMPELQGEKFLDRLDQALIKHNQRQNDSKAHAPPVLFFRRPQSPYLSILSSHLMLVLGTKTVATPNEFASMLKT